MIYPILIAVLTYGFLLSDGRLSLAQAQFRAAHKAVTSASTGKLAYTGYSLERLKAMQPRYSNPYLSFLPTDSNPDWAYWQVRMRAEAVARRSAFTRTMGTPIVGESEPNNELGTGNPIEGFGNDPELTPSIDVIGTFSPPPAASSIGPFEEDDGAIPHANVSGLTTGQRVKITAQIGDGPHGLSGSGQGDFDFYAISGVTAGQIITADINTADIDVQDEDMFFDSFLAIWDSAGNLLATNDDAPLNGNDSFMFDSFILFEAPQDGTYYLSVGAADAPVPDDPLDSSSGPGAFSEGPYELILGLDALDVDFFSVELKAGDVVNVNGLGAAAYVSLFDPAGVELVTSNNDYTQLLPPGGPFAAGDNPSLVRVIDQPGIYWVRVLGSRAAYYLAELRTARPPLELEPGSKQVLFIDFDSAVVDVSIFGDVGRRFLSPLRAFLGNWGLQPSDESSVIDAILAVAEENIQNDVLANGNNPKFDIQILNSRDHEDPFGDPHVSRVIVGGTMNEIGFATIGMAESIDVGNFNTTETALVLLDLLSDTGDNPDSLNSFMIDPSTSMIDWIGTALGNLVAHEAGHLFGNFHTDPLNPSANLMDQGGNIANIFGVGPDAVFGTADDVDVDFGLDTYLPDENLLGIQDTLNTIAFGLSTMPNDLVSTVLPGPLVLHQGR